MKHTALPWTEPRIYTDGNGVPYRITIYGKGGTPVCSIKVAGRDYIAEGNFNLISRACNCHEELVEACNYALEQIQRTFDITDQIHMPPGWLDADIGLNNARGSLQEVLAKATK